MLAGLIALSIAGCGGNGGGSASAPTPNPVYACTLANAATVCNDGNALTIDGCSNPSTEQAACTHTPIGCNSAADCDDGDALTIEACANPGTASSACAWVAIACNTDGDCDDANSNTIDSCSNGGTVSSACANVVNRTMWVQVTAINPTTGNVPVSGASVEVLNPNGATTYAGVTDANGVVEITGRSAGTHVVSISQNPGSVPHFVQPSSQNLVIDATGSATATFNVTPAYSVTVGAYNVNLLTEIFDGASYHLTCGNNNYAAVGSAMNPVVFADVPYATGCTASSDNLAGTSPKMASDTPASQSVDVTGNQIVILTAAKPECVQDTDCPIPMGTTTPVCLDPGTSYSSCAAF